jgi:GTPase Era involved in 16S rRNA processing
MYPPAMIGADESGAKTDKSLNIDRLLEIADFLGAKDAAKALAFLRARSEDPNAEIIIPFVGEFSSGKTTLINALMGGEKLETARERTTATIFEARFTQDTERAIIFWQDGRQEEVGDLTMLRNDRLGYPPPTHVCVFATSTRIPPTTVIADTPGLSSLVPKNREALAAYLPRADAVFIVIDINTGDTSRSLIDFMNVASLARKDAYAVITKCNTKAPPERQKVRAQIAETLKLDRERIACVSAKEGDIDEFLELVRHIQTRKNKIIKDRIEQQTVAVRNALAEQVLMLLKSADMPTDELDREIAVAKRAEQEIRARIKRAVPEMETIVDSVASKTVNDFNQRIMGSLDALVRNPPQGMDLSQAASSSVNSTASLMFANFKSDVYAEVRNTLHFADDDNALALGQVNNAIQSVSGVVPFSGDLLLPELQEINKIATGVLKATANVIAAVATSGVSEIAAVGITSLASGLIEGLVGKVTGAIAKPQRQKIINDWIISTLQPEFRQNLTNISRGIIGNIETLLIENSQASVAELQDNLQTLKAKKVEAASEYKERIARLKTYQTALITDGKS